MLKMPETSFLQKLSLNLIHSEKEMLVTMRDAAEAWFNEVSEPFLPLLDPHSQFVSPAERLKLSELATEMFRAQYLVNSGDALENKLREIDRSVGVPLFSGRTDLRARTEQYLGSGTFVKRFTYGALSKASSASREMDDEVREARMKWAVFRQNKDALVRQINKQLSRIG
jgi:hypothetical protein